MDDYVRREKGLENKLGENNCFLNVVIQGLWHLDSFMKSFMETETHNHSDFPDSCIFCALKVVFSQYKFGEESVVPPTALREALSRAFASQARFQLGKLDDAAEALDEVLHCLHETVADASNMDSIHCAPLCFVHKIFGIHLLQQYSCEQINCGASSEGETSSMNIYYAYSAALREKHKLRPTLPFDLLLAVANEPIRRKCPNEKCGAVCRVKQFLLNQPKVFVIGIVWDTDSPTVMDITATLDIIEQEINLNNILDLIPDPEQTSESVYSLKGMICYYGMHYDAYCKVGDVWWVFDDAMVKEVGVNTWERVKDRCVRGKFQPSLLFYEISDAPPKFKDTENHTSLIEKQDTISTSYKPTSYELEMEKLRQKHPLAFSKPTTAPSTYNSGTSNSPATSHQTYSSNLSSPPVDYTYAKYGSLSSTKSSHSSTSPTYGALSSSSALHRVSSLPQSSYTRSTRASPTNTTSRSLSSSTSALQRASSYTSRGTQTPSSSIYAATSSRARSSQITSMDTEPTYSASSIHTTSLHKSPIHTTSTRATDSRYETTYSASYSAINPSTTSLLSNGSKSSLSSTPSKPSTSSATSKPLTFSSTEPKPSTFSATTKSTYSQMDTDDLDNMVPRSTRRLFAPEDYQEVNKSISQQHYDINPSKPAYPYNNRWR